MVAIYTSKHDNDSYEMEVKNRNEAYQTSSFVHDLKKWKCHKTDVKITFRKGKLTPPDWDKVMEIPIEY